MLDLVYKNVKRKGGESGRIDLTNERTTTTFFFYNFSAKTKQKINLRVCGNMAQSKNASLNAK